MDHKTLDSVTIFLDNDGRTAKSFVRDLTRDMDGPTLLKLVDFLTHTNALSGFLTARATIRRFADLHGISADM